MAQLNRGTPGKFQRKEAAGSKAPRKSGKRALQKSGPKTNRASVKNQIRSVSRQIQKGGLDAGALVALQQRLETLQATLTGNQLSEKARKNATKYHKVRFFERVKLERRIQKLEQDIEPDRTPAEQDAKKAQLSQLRDDLQYVLHFPKEEKYISIIQTPEDPTAAAAVLAQIARLKTIVRSRLRDGALLADADEGASLAQPPASTAQAGDSTAAEEDDFFLASDDDGERTTDAQKEKPVVSLSNPSQLTGVQGQSARHLLNQRQAGKQKQAGPPVHKRKPALVMHTSTASPDKHHKIAGASLASKLSQHQQVNRRQGAPPAGDTVKQQKRKEFHHSKLAPQQVRSSKPAHPASAAVSQAKVAPISRTRAEGGRKRRKK